MSDSKIKIGVPFWACLLAVIFFCGLEAICFNEVLDRKTDEAYEDGHTQGFAEGQHNEYEILKPRLEKAEGKLNDISVEYEFFHNNAVVCDTDTYRYHHYGCRDFQSDSYYIFNNGYAKYIGYLPCETCIK